jgi:16S rRNA (cytosine967-C5)-methyltransferase
VLARVEETRSYANRVLSAALDRARSLSPEDRALATELVYGVLRRQGRLDRALEAVSDRGLSGLDARVRIALRIAAYQILFLDRIPAYAAVSDAVDACKTMRGPRIGGLANALLRRLAERGEPPLPSADSDPLGYLIEVAGLPEWLARLILAEQPVSEAVAFADALGVAAPLALRANTLRVDREGLLARLADERPGAELTFSPIAPHGVLARHMDSPFLTEAWTEGAFAVEDLGAQVVVELLGARPGERILDACAGVGGKSAQLAALAGNQAQIEAVDISPAKLSQARALFHRLGVKGVAVRAADLTQPLSGSEGGYDRILLDAPCSGLGVLRRHPEAARARGPDDLTALAATQRRLLDALVTHLRPQGAIVYSVCTFNRQECEEQIQGFLASHPDFRIERPEASPGATPWAELTDAEGLVRTWPHRHDADAFFAVRLRRGG